MSYSASTFAHSGLFVKRSVRNLYWVICGASVLLTDSMEHINSVPPCAVVVENLNSNLSTFILSIYFIWVVTYLMLPLPAFLHLIPWSMLHLYSCNKILFCYIFWATPLPLPFRISSSYILVTSRHQLPPYPPWASNPYNWQDLLYAKHGIVFRKITSCPEVDPCSLFPSPKVVFSRRKSLRIAGWWAHIIISL